MARLFTAASSEYLIAPDRAGFDGTDGTAACCFKTSASGSHQNMLRRDAGSGTFGVNRMFLLRVSDVDKVQVQLIIGGVPGVVSASTFNDGAWHHAAATWSWDGINTTVRLYVDGSLEGSATDGSSFSASTEPIYIGANANNGSPVEFFDGSLAECATWSVALTAAEIATLSKGYSPAQIRPGSLALYVPLVREIVDHKGTAPTATGTAASAHPRVLYPRRRSTARNGTAAPAITVPRIVHHRKMQGIA